MFLDRDLSLKVFDPNAKSEISKFEQLMEEKEIVGSEEKKEEKTLRGNYTTALSI